MTLNRNRILLACMPALALAACNAPVQGPANSDQPNESVVEAQMEASQDAVDDSIANDAANDSAQDNATADNDGDDPSGAHSYRCNDGSTIVVLYGDDDGTARLTRAEQTIAMLEVDVPSGSKYHTDDETVVWTVNDTSAQLLRTPKGGKAVSLACNEGG